MQKIMKPASVRKSIDETGSLPAWHIWQSNELICRDREDFYKLVKTYRPALSSKVENHMKNALGNHEIYLDFEDITSLAFENLERKLELKGLVLDYGRGFVAYVFTAAKNALSRLSKKPSFNPVRFDGAGASEPEMDTLEPFESPGHEPTWMESLMKEFRSCFKKRPVDFEIMARHIINGEKLVSIATTMGLEHDAVRQKYKRAKEVFRRRLEKLSEDDEKWMSLKELYPMFIEGKEFDIRGATAKIGRSRRKGETDTDTFKTSFLCMRINHDILVERNPSHRTVRKDRPERISDASLRRIFKHMYDMIGIEDQN
jgi:DNA-directed RNA polymerase specialized sigma24 family protein